MAQNGGDWRFTQSPQARVVQPTTWTQPQPQPVYQQPDWRNRDYQQAHGWPSTDIRNYPPGNSYQSLERTPYRQGFEQFNHVEDSATGWLGVFLFAGIFFGVINPLHLPDDVTTWFIIGWFVLCTAVYFLIAIRKAVRRRRY